MAEMRIGLRELRELKSDSTIYDSEVKGFGARRQRSEAITFFVRYRTAEGRERTYKIGRWGAPWTPAQARGEAKRILGQVAEGKDPAAEREALRAASTMDELCDAYLKDMVAGRLLTRSGRAKKASTATIDAGRIRTHIKPLLGRIIVTALTQQDVRRFMHEVADGKTAKREPTGKKRGLSNIRGGKGTATRTMGLLGAILQFAIEKGIRADNPARGIRKFAEGKRDRRLSNEEYAALGKALAKAAEPPPRKPHSRPDVEQRGMWEPALAAIRFLALTGWRSGEALRLKWAEVDLEKRTAFLGDTKTGRSVRPLSHAALKVLRTLPQIGDSGLVFPGYRGGGAMLGFISYFQKVAKLAGFGPDVVPHTLRHSFASQAADLGTSEPTIGALIGHKGQTITSRYIHGADAVLLAEADKVGRKIAELMGDAPGDAVVVPLKGIA